MAQNPPDWFRGAEIILGLISLAVSMIILLNPGYGTGTLILLLSFGLLLSAARTIATAGLRQLETRIKRIGIAGGSLVIAIVLIVIFYPGIGGSTLVYLLSGGLIVQGLARVAHVAHRGHPSWLRGYPRLRSGS